MFAVIVAAGARRFKGDWRRGCRRAAKKSNRSNDERRARVIDPVVSFCRCYAWSKRDTIRLREAPEYRTGNFSGAVHVNRAGRRLQND